MKLRSTCLILAIALSVSACDDISGLSLSADDSYPTKNVGVYSRTWAVTQVAADPVIYRATRDWNNLNPYGPPARTRTSQAVAAFKAATGCTPIRSSMYQNISGQFFAQVKCP
ncbi:MAG: hypothetical protein AAF408_08290 [Pseudomonadota bacterium]